MRRVFNPRCQITPLAFGLSPLSSLNFSIQRLLRAFTSFLHGYPPRHSVFVAPFLGAFHTFLRLPFILLAKRWRVFLSLLFVWKTAIFSSLGWLLSGFFLAWYSHGFLLALVLVRASIFI